MSERDQKGIQDHIAEMVRRIVERFHPEKIILFGSHARGDAGPDSDVDLLVVMPVEGSRRERSIEIGVALHDIPVSKDIIVATFGDIERRKNIPGSIIKPAIVEGKVFYEQTA